MVAKALALVLLVLAACTGIQLQPTPGQREPVAHAIRHSTLLDPPGCTGVVVAKYVVVTAKHCIEDSVKAQDYVPGMGLVVYISPNHDFIVVIQGARYGYQFIRMRQAVPGEHLYLVGYPQQVRNGKQALTVTDGIFTGVVDESGDERITAPAYFGNSGGGVWADDGALVGILVNGDFAEAGKWPMPYPGTSYMVPVAKVVEGLNDSL